MELPCSRKRVWSPVSSTRKFFSLVMQDSLHTSLIYSPDVEECLWASKRQDSKASLL